MNLTLRNKLVINFLVVVIITGLIATWVGIHLIGKGIIRQAQEKVRMDLNSAREIYREDLERIKILVRLTASRFFLREGLLNNDLNSVRTELRRIKETEAVDILTVTDHRGVVLFRSRNPKISDDNQKTDEIIQRVLSGHHIMASTEIITSEELIKEGEDLAKQARMKFITTPKAKPRPQAEETSGMMIKAAAPILDNTGRLIGVLYGGILLNRNYTIVDKVKDTVYKGQTYKGKDIGTATIFQKDLRISTNVKRKDGTRAIGTRVSEEVYDQVLIRGLPWIERAFVVNSWYITAYEPIKNVSNEIIGILYVGILEEKFVDLEKKTVLMFFGITLAGIVVAIIISYFLAIHILKPIKYLVFASKQLAAGDLTQKVQIESKDMIGELATTFNVMVDSLRERDERLKMYAQRKIMESERLATIGQLAAGVAHELNNPLGGVLVYSHLLLEKLQKDDPSRKQLEKIVTQAKRCNNIVKGLLDFARQTEPRMERMDINKLIESTLPLIENQAQFQNIQIQKQFQASLPKIMIDGAQMQQVFINILLNGAEAIEDKGMITIKTKLSGSGQEVDIEFNDTGCGISEENLKRLFEPFFTTKEVGKGTGLGLAVSYGIIQRHDGKIEVESQVGKGTTFLIQLPIRSKSGNMKSNESTHKQVGNEEWEK